MVGWNHRNWINNFRLVKDENQVGSRDIEAKEMFAQNGRTRRLRGHFLGPNVAFPLVEKLVRSRSSFLIGRDLHLATRSPMQGFLLGMLRKRLPLVPIFASFILRSRVFWRLPRWGNFSPSISTCPFHSEEAGYVCWAEVTKVRLERDVGFEVQGEAARKLSVQRQRLNLRHRQGIKVCSYKNMYLRIFFSFLFLTGRLSRIFIVQGSHMECTSYRNVTAFEVFKISCENVSVWVDAAILWIYLREIKIWIDIAINVEKPPR